MKILAGIFLFLFVFTRALLIFPQGVLSAENIEFSISEIMFDPDGADGDREWIEIYARDDLSFTDLKSLGGKFVLPFRSCDKYDKEKDDCSTSHPIYFSENCFSISKGDFFIVAKDKSEFLKNYPDYEGKILESKFTLTNKKEGNFVGLYEEMNDKTNWIDKVNYNADWGGGNNGRTLEKNDLAESDNKNNWEQSVLLGGTPGKKYEKTEIKYSEKIVISEILPDPEGDDSGEWVELFNADRDDVDLAEWSVKDASGKQHVLKDKIKAGEYLVIYSKVSLNNSGDALFLLNPLGKEVFSTSYGKVSASDFSWALDDDGDFQWTSILTPGEKNRFPEKKSYPRKVLFNEILLNPDGKDKDNEWIEFENGNDFEVDLEDWMIQNSRKSKFKIQSVKIPALGFGVVNLKETSFQIKNSNETLKLLDPNGELVDEMTIQDSSPMDRSYNRSEKNTWHWSRFLTPGKENKLNSPAKIVVKKPAKIFKDMPVEFSAEGTKDKDKDKLKFRWDFGDGHRSYLEKTTHTYEKKGKYLVSLMIDDGSEQSLRDFEIEVKNFPKLDLEITRVKPNPKGKDSEGEEIEIRNNSSKRIDLEKFKIATGKDKKSLVNHIIKDSLTIEKDESKTITRQNCPFSLLNKKGVVALKYPNNKTAGLVEYGKEKIVDDEEYVLSDGVWKWTGGASKSEGKNKTEDKNEQNLPESEENLKASENIDIVNEIVSDEDDLVCHCIESLAVNNWRKSNKIWLRWFDI